LRRFPITGGASEEAGALLSPLGLELMIPGGAANRRFPIFQPNFGRQMRMPSRSYFRGFHYVRGVGLFRLLENWSPEIEYPA
jgi:hypothetical protein